VILCVYVLVCISNRGEEGGYEYEREENRLNDVCVRERERERERERKREREGENI